MNVPLQMVPTNTMVENVSGEGGVHVAIAWRFRIVAASVGIEATFLEIPNLKQDGLIGMNIFKMVILNSVKLSQITFQKIIFRASSSIRLLRGSSFICG